MAAANRRGAAPGGVAAAGVCTHGGGSLKSMILTWSKSSIFIFEINDFTSEIDDFMRCEINAFETRFSLISMFEIIDFISLKSLILDQNQCF